MQKKSTKKPIVEKDVKPASKKKAGSKKAVSNLRKLKILITVIDKSKALFYLDLLEQFEVNVQLVLHGRGTANSQMLNLLGISESDKSVIISYIREDRIKEALETLSEKFIKVKNGKGIAFTVPLDSIIGVSAYQLLSNDQMIREGGNINEKRL